MIQPRCHDLLFPTSTSAPYEVVSISEMNSVYQKTFMEFVKGFNAGVTSPIELVISLKRETNCQHFTRRFKL